MRADLLSKLGISVWVMICAALHLTAVSASAAPTVKPTPTPPPPPIFSTALTKVRDLNNDGLADLVLLESRSLDAGLSFKLQTIRFVSGSGLEEIVKFSPARDNLVNPRAYGLGDIDHDGYADVAIVTESNKKQRADVCSYLFRHLWSTHSSTQFREKAANGLTVLVMTWMTDIDADGYDDIVVGTAEERPEVRVLRLFSGRTGLPVAQAADVRQVRAKADQLFAQSIATLDDVNGDGVPDVVVAGTPKAKARQGAFSVFSGKNLVLLKEVRGRTNNKLLADDVLPAVDLNKDGKREFVVSELDRTNGRHVFYIYNGVSFQPMYSINLGMGFTRLNSRVVDFVSDVDYDCVPEVLVTADDVTLRLYSGDSGNLIDNVGSASSFGVLSSPGGIPHSYKIAVNSGGKSATLGIIDLETVFFPPPKLKPVCAYTRDPYL